MKGKAWQKPLAAFQHLRFHGKKQECLAARVLQQISKERSGLVLQHWGGLQTTCKSSCGIWMTQICFSRCYLHSQPWQFQCLQHEMCFCWTKPGKKREKAELAKVCVSFSDRPEAWAMLWATCCKTAGGKAWGRTCCCFHVPWGWGDVLEMWLFCTPYGPKLR